MVLGMVSGGDPGNWSAFRLASRTRPAMDASHLHNTSSNDPTSLTSSDQSADVDKFHFGLARSEATNTTPQQSVTTSSVPQHTYVVYTYRTVEVASAYKGRSFLLGTVRSSNARRKATNPGALIALSILLLGHVPSAGITVPSFAAMSKVRE